MRRHLILFFIFCFLAAPAFAEDNKPEMMKGAKLADIKPTPAIIVGANEVAENIVEGGWPIIVSVTMLSEDTSSIPVPNNLQPKLLNENNNSVPLNFNPVVSENNETKFWIVSESETQSLTNGSYIISLEPVEGVTIHSGELVVSATNPEHAAGLNNLKIQKLLLQGKDDEALTEAHNQTTNDTENVDAWIAKGDILMGKDLPDKALKAYEKALEIAEKTENEPLFIQERHRAAFFRSLEKRGVIKAGDNQP